MEPPLPATTDDPIRIDPETGRKVFSTRAAPAASTRVSAGYSVVADERLTSLPEPPAGAVFDAEEQAKLLLR